MEPIVKQSVMFIITLVLALVFLRMANDYGSYWINVSWAVAVLFGIETTLYLNIIQEWKKSKEKIKEENKNEYNKRRTTK